MEDGKSHLKIGLSALAALLIAYIAIVPGPSYPAVIGMMSQDIACTTPDCLKIIDPTSTTAKTTSTAAKTTSTTITLTPLASMTTTLPLADCDVADINVDGRLKGDDVEECLRSTGTTGCKEDNYFCDGLDMNKNGFVDVPDCVIVAVALLRCDPPKVFGKSFTCKALDVDGDGYIDMDDAAACGKNIGMVGCEKDQAICGGGDIDDDGGVTAIDFMLVSWAQGTDCSQTSTPVTFTTFTTTTTTIPPAICGGADINRDGTVDRGDTEALSPDLGRLDCGEGNGFCGGSDVNADGKVSIMDIVAIEKMLGKTGCAGSSPTTTTLAPPGCAGADLNDDGRVDYTDNKILTLYDGRLDCGPKNSWCGLADINRDGKVSKTDLSLLTQNNGRLDCKGTTTTVTTTSTTTTSTLPMAGCDGMDLDEDGSVGGRDSSYLFKRFGMEDCAYVNSWCDLADINRDGKVSSLDVSLLEKNQNRTNCTVWVSSTTTTTLLRPGCGGADLTRDGRVDALDNEIYSAHSGRRGCNKGNSFCGYVDINRDGVISPNDLGIIVAYMGARNCGTDESGISRSGCSGADINRDGKVDNRDKTVMDSQMGSKTCNELDIWCSGADINHDGRVDDIDAGTISAFIGSDDCESQEFIIENICEGADVDGDGVVDAADAEILKKNDGRNDCGPSSWCEEADVNRDGYVNAFDYNILKKHIGEEECLKLTEKTSLYQEAQEDEDDSSKGPKTTYYDAEGDRPDEGASSDKGRTVERAKVEAEPGKKRFANPGDSVDVAIRVSTDLGIAELTASIDPPEGLMVHDPDQEVELGKGGMKTLSWDVYVSPDARAGTYKLPVTLRDVQGYTRGDTSASIEVEEPLIEVPVLEIKIASSKVIQDRGFWVVGSVFSHQVSLGMLLPAALIGSITLLYAYLVWRKRRITPPNKG